MIDIFEQLTPNDICTNVAHNVKLRRKEMKLTQEQLSIRSNVSLGSIKRFERTGEISLKSLAKISIVLGYEDDFSYLFKKKKYNSIQEVIDENI